MLTSRNIIVLAALLTVVSIIVGVYSLTRPPDSGGMGADSYGTHGLGNRGLYETLEELGWPVSRGMQPPGRGVEPGTTLVLWAPDDQLVAAEPVHLRELRHWVEAGGRLVVAPRHEEESMEDEAWAEAADDELKHFDTTLLEALELSEVSVITIAPPKEGTTQDHPPATTDAERMRNWRELAEEFTARSLVLTEQAVRREGAVGDLEPAGWRIAMPATEVRVLALNDRPADGRLLIDDADGDPQTLAAAFRRGQGEVVLVAEPVLFDNVALGRADNGVLAVQLLAGGERPIVFDEFYHGLNVRGNPFWLLTRPRYALFATAILLLIAGCVWRAGVLLGPPLTTPEPTRRTITEYIDAMSRFFHRGRRTQAFLVQTVRDGVLRSLAEEHGLPAVHADPDALAEVVARSDPERAARLKAAAAVVDDALARGDNCGEPEAVAAIASLTACLERRARCRLSPCINRSATKSPKSSSVRTK